MISIRKDKFYKDLLLKLNNINNFQKLMKLQNISRKYEDILVKTKKYPILIINKKYINNKLINKFVLLTSLPYIFIKNKLNNDEIKIYKEKLDKLWNSKSCKRCNFMIHRKTVPTGNLNAKYFIIGEAPGVGDGKEYFDRVFVYGPSSHLLRLQMHKYNIHKYAIYSNLMKCAYPKNRKGNFNEYDECFGYLNFEIHTIRPAVIILLGKQVINFFKSKYGHNLQIGEVYLNNNYKIFPFFHPSFFIYKRNLINKFSLFRYIK